MPKVFKESTTKEYRVLDDGSSSNDIKIDLTQHYVFKMGGEKTLNSLVTLKMRDGVIQHHEEEWDHQENKDGEDGFLGKMNEWRKKVDAKVVEKMVPSDPSKV